MNLYENQKWIMTPRRMILGTPVSLSVTCPGLFILGDAWASMSFFYICSCWLKLPGGRYPRGLKVHHQRYQLGRKKVKNIDTKQSNKRNNQNSKDKRQE